MEKGRVTGPFLFRSKILKTVKVLIWTLDFQI